MAVTDSLDNLIASALAKGMFIRSLYLLPSASTTAANTTSGYVTTQRIGSFTMPSSFGSGVTGAWPTYVRVLGLAATAGVCAIEYSLGTLTVSGNSFAGGVSMPTKTVAGVSLSTASLLPFVVITTTLVATTPILTITYTDQDGNTGNSCAMTLPTNSLINSGFLMVPHLAAADTGVRAVTNMSISTGSAGVIKVYGLLPISLYATGSAAARPLLPDILPGSLPWFMLEASEVVAFYRFGSTAQNRSIATFGAVAEY